MATVRSNILVIIPHDTGRFLGCYGHGVKTPALDALAEGGIRFDNYFCPAPQFSPSRASILTGPYPHRNGMMGLLTWALASMLARRRSLGRWPNQDTRRF